MILVKSAAWLLTFLTAVSHISNSHFQVQQRIIAFDCSGKADAAYSIGCSQNYWWCWEGKATKLACPEGMMFNGENNQCDFESNIFECTGQRVTPSPTSASDFATPPPGMFSLI